MNTRADVLLQYLRSEFPGFDSSDVTKHGDVDYSFCVQRPGEIFSLRVCRVFVDRRSGPEIAWEIRRIDLAAAVRQLGAAIVTPAGTVESLGR